MDCITLIAFDVVPMNDRQPTETRLYIVVGFNIIILFFVGNFGHVFRDIKKILQCLTTHCYDSNVIYYVNKENNLTKKF